MCLSLSLSLYVSVFACVSDFPALFPLRSVMDGEASVMIVVGVYCVARWEDYWIFFLEFQSALGMVRIPELSGLMCRGVT